MKHPITVKNYLDRIVTNKKINLHMSMIIAVLSAGRGERGKKDAAL